MADFVPPPATLRERVRLLSDADELRILDILRGMTLHDKIGQTFQPNWRCLRSAASGLLSTPLSGLTRGAAPSSFLGRAHALFSHSESAAIDAAAAAAVTQHGLGAVLGDGGAAPLPNEPATWRTQAQALQTAASATRSKVPLLIGNDTVHGQSNLKHATIFPHHIGQGCMRDASGQPDAARVEALARLAARESHACGINWAFSPCVAVPRDLRWGRTYEGFSEDVSIVAVLGAAEVRGLQRAGVPMAACLKHCAPRRT